MEKVRICFTSPSLNAYSETFIRNLKDGLDADIFHCYGAVFPYLSEDKKLQNFKTPPLIDLFLRKIGFIRRNLKEHYLISYFRSNSINLIFANYGPSGAALASIAQFLNVPLIVHFHGYDASIFDVLKKHQSSYKQMFAIAKLIIVVSEEMRKDLIAIGAPEEKLIKIIYSPKPFFLEVVPDFHSNQILAIGRFVEKKAPHLTLLAFQKARELYPELHLKFIGSGELLGVCQDLCNAFHIKNVKFVGILSPEEIAYEMSQSFCFIQHSKQALNGDKEGAPVAVLEALAAGLPVISTKHAGISEIIEDDKNGYLVEEGDIESMAQKLILIHKYRVLSKRMSEYNKEKVIKYYNQKDYFLKLNQAIEASICND